MRASTSTAALALFALGASALTITSPTEQAVWSASGSETIKWESVSSDASSFAVILSNQVAYPATTVLLASNVQTSAGSASVSYPNGNWPVGTSYRINIVKSDTELDHILAQSAQFDIIQSSSAATTETTKTAGSTAALVAPTTLARASSKAVPTAVASAEVAVAAAAESSAAVDTIPNSSANKTSAASSKVSLTSGALLLAVVGAVGSALF